MLFEVCELLIDLKGGSVARGGSIERGGSVVHARDLVPHADPGLIGSATGLHLSDHHRAARVRPRGPEAEAERGFECSLAKHVLLQRCKRSIDRMNLENVKAKENDSQRFM